MADLPTEIDIGSLQAPMPSAAPSASPAPVAAASATPIPTASIQTGSLAGLPTEIDIASLTAPLSASGAPPPTPTAPSASSSQPSASEAAARGAFDGLTFGFGPKATNALGLTNKEGFENARTAHPMAYMGGQVAGTAPWMLVPGLGEAGEARAAFAASGLTGQAAKEAAAEFMPSALTIAARPFVNGAVAGGLSGAGHSEGDVSDAAKEAAKGAVMGAILPGLGKSLGVVSHVVDHIPLLGHVTGIVGLPMKAIDNIIANPRAAMTAANILPSTEKRN